MHLPAYPDLPLMSQSHLRLIGAEGQPLDSLLPNLFISHPQPAAQVLEAELTPDSSLSSSPTVQPSPDPGLSARPAESDPPSPPPRPHDPRLSLTALPAPVPPHPPAQSLGSRPEPPVLTGLHSPDQV